MRHIMKLKGKLGRLFSPTPAVRQTGRPPTSFIRVAYHTPRQVVLMTARHDGLENVWPIDWHVPLSLEPELYGVSLTSDSFGANLVRASGCFVVNFVPASWEEIILFCGSKSGKVVDKFAETGLQREPATAVNVSRLKDALGYLECEVVQVMEVGDHTLFVGAVRHAAQKGDAARLHHVDGRLVDVTGDFGDVTVSG